MIKEFAPICLFVYNRPWHTQQTIEALQLNELANQSDLIIFSDSPKNEHAWASVKEVRDYLKIISGFKSIRIIERQENWGLAKSIIHGVSDVVNQYGKVIVVEDDLVTSPHFLRFMNEALEIYKDETKVFGITGYSYPIKSDKVGSTYFLKAEGCWSWATWQRAWNFFEKDTYKLLNIFTKKMIYEFNFDNSENFFSQVIDNKNGKINSWAVYWYATIFLNEGLFLCPKYSFTRNIGFDGSGVHCSESVTFDMNPTQNYNITFETNIKESKKAREAHIEYFNSLKVSFYKRVLNKIKRYFESS